MLELYGMFIVKMNTVKIVIFNNFLNVFFKHTACKCLVVLN